MEMRITVNREKSGFEYSAKNHLGHVVKVDGSPDRKAMRPMELLLSAMATCTAFDTADILTKQRQDLQDLQIEISGKRPEDGYPKPFKAMHLTYTLVGEIDEDKARRAVELAVEKYCSVRESLHPDIKITYEVKLRRTKVVE